MSEPTNETTMFLEALHACEETFATLWIGRDHGITPLALSSLVRSWERALRVLGEVTGSESMTERAGILARTWSRDKDLIRRGTGGCGKPASPPAELPSQIGKEPSCGEDHNLAIWYDPASIRSHFEGLDDEDWGDVQDLSDFALQAAAEKILSGDAIWGDFDHYAAAIVRLAREEDAKEAVMGCTCGAEVPKEEADQHIAQCDGKPKGGDDAE